MRCRRSIFTAFPVPPHAATDATTHYYQCRRVPPLMPPPIFIGAATCHPCLSVPLAASLSPAKREVKREAEKCGRGVRKNQTSSGSLVRSLVVGTAADSEWICIAPDRILHQGAGSFHSGLDLRAPTCSDACHTMLNVRLSRPTQPLPHTLSYLIL